MANSMVTAFQRMCVHACSYSNYGNRETLFCTTSRQINCTYFTSLVPLCSPTFSLLACVYLYAQRADGRKPIRMRPRGRIIVNQLVRAHGWSSGTRKAYVLLQHHQLLHRQTDRQRDAQSKNDLNNFIDSGRQPTA